MTDKIQQAIERAKSGAKDRPGPPNITGRFDDAGRLPSQAPTGPISQDTLDGLSRVSRMQAPAPQEPATPEEPLPAPKTLYRFAEELLRAEGVQADDLSGKVASALKAAGAPPVPTKDEAERLDWESKAGLQALDIGELIMTNRLSQTVPIIPGKLEVQFTSLTDGVQAFLAERLQEIRSRHGSSMLISEFYQWQARVALACQVTRYAGAQWPALTDADGTVLPKAYEARMSKVQHLSDHLFPMVVRHMAWFNARVAALLRDSESLGNG
jgi:hypothetical protein